MELLKNIHGHKDQLQSLMQAIQKNRLPHALLFTGPGGVGKKTSAWAIAQTLLCNKHPACGKCTSCQQVAAHTNKSVLFIEPDGLQIKAKAVRQILDFVSLQSFSPARVVLIESAHLMNRSASGSLLKILEEPPPNVYFILITPQLFALLPTIRSRTQIIRFMPLINNMPVQKNTPEWMIKAAQGRMDILTELEEKKELREHAFSLLKNAINQQTSPLNTLPDLVRDRTQALFIALCWQQIFRDACIAKLQSDKIIHSDQDIQKIKKLPAHILHTLFEQSLQLEKDIKSYVDPVLTFDHTLLKISELAT